MAAFHHRSSLPSGGPISVALVSVISAASGRWTPPPDAALTSAAYIGPKSRRMLTTINPKRRASSG